MSNDIRIDFTPPGPVAQKFLESTAAVTALFGPIGSAKSSTAVVKIIMHIATQKPGPDGLRHSRWGIVRNSYRDLKGATLKTWHDWIPRAFGKVTMGSPIIHLIEHGDIRAEILMFPLDSPEDAERLRSFEFTGLWFDEVSELPYEIIQAALGRVGRYPSMRNGGPSWAGVLMTSNMTDPDHWTYAKYEKPPSNWAFFVQPGGLDDGAENIANLPGGRRYYENLVESNDETWCKRFVHAQFVPVQTGKVVYPQFRDAFHVAEKALAPSPDLGVVLALDFGLTPACVFLQQQADGRVVCFDELVGEDVGLQRFAQRLSTYWQQNYSHLKVTGAFGDPAGTARSTDTERTAFDVFNAHTQWRWKPASTNEISVRIEAVSWFLNKAVDGRPGFVLSPKCSVLRAGFNGKYSYQPIRSANGATYHDQPTKGMASHIHDALQYGILGLGGADLVVGREKRTGNRATQASGMDDPVLTVGRDHGSDSQSGIGVRWGTRIDRGERQRPRQAAGMDHSIFG